MSAPLPPGRVRPANRQPDDRHTGGYCTTACAPGCTRFASIVPAPSAGQDAGQWRVGQHYGIHVYEGDRPVATFHRAEDAGRAVEAVNRALDQS